jgi:hypothetical protein
MFGFYSVIAWWKEWNNENTFAVSRRRPLKPPRHADYSDITPEATAPV